MTNISGVEADGSVLEIEVKLGVSGAGEALGRLARLPAALRDGRRFEQNEIYDTPDRALSGRRDLLRLRVVEGRGILTFKRVVESEIRAKVRAETQTAVSSPGAMREILRSLGFTPIYRYEKYRAYYEWVPPGPGSPLAISLDETPIGVFMELEGARESIDRAAALMGYAEEDYIVDDYRALHVAWLGARGLPRGDMVFAAAPHGGEAR